MTDRYTRTRRIRNTVLDRQVEANMRRSDLARAVAGVAFLGLCCLLVLMNLADKP